jgi:hypothetical protein
MLYTAQQHNEFLVRPRRRREDNIEMGLTQMGLERMDWIHLLQERNLQRNLVNTVLNLQVPQKAMNFLTR